MVKSHRIASELFSGHYGELKRRKGGGRERLTVIGSAEYVESLMKPAFDRLRCHRTGEPGLVARPPRSGARPDDEEEARAHLRELSKGRSTVS